MYLYGISLAVLLVAGIAFLFVLQRSNTQSAIGKLGRGEREFQEARHELLLGSDNPVPKLLEYIKAPENGTRGRLHALEILCDLSSHYPIDDGPTALNTLIRQDVPELVNATLEAYARFGAAEHAGAVSHILSTTPDSLRRVKAFEALTAVTHPVTDAGERRLYGKTLSERLRRAVDTRDSAAVDSVAAILDSLPVGKGYLFTVLSDYYRVKGEFEKASELRGRLGTINKWWVTGGWPNHKMAAFLKELPPETGPFSPTDSFEIRDGVRVGWFPIRRSESDGTIRIRHLFAQQLYSVAYFFTYIHAKEDRRAFLFLGSDDGLRVWCNDSLVHGNKTFRPVKPDQDLAAINLKKGANTLLIKVLQDVGGWGLNCRLTDVHGEAITGCMISLSPSPAENTVERLLANSLSGANPDSGLENIDPEDASLARSLVSIVADETEETSRRIEAAKLLERINRVRSVPAGERILLATGSRLVKASAAPDLTTAVITALISMGTQKGLDLGLRCRESASPHLKYMGNRLIGRYCRSRIFQLGDLSSKENANEISRMVQEIMSLAPTDAWVLGTIAAYYRERGDTVASRKIEHALNMPAHWIANRNAVNDSNDIATVAKSLAADDFEEFWTKCKKAGTGRVDGWRGFGLTSHGEPSEYRMYLSDFDKVGLHVRGKPSNWWHLLAGGIESPVDTSVLLTVSIPRYYQLFFNGTRIETKSYPHYREYYFGEFYPWRPIGFDIHTYPVRLRKGMNTVVIATADRVMTWRIRQAYLRSAILTQSGEPIGCTGRAVNLDLKGDHRDKSEFPSRTTAEY